MSLAANNKIAHADIMARFQSAVVNNILAGAAHAGAPPMLLGFQCVPVSIMDHLNNVNQIPNHQDSKQTAISATLILKDMIDLTRNLTRVGTYAFSVWRRNTSGGVDRSGFSVPSSSWVTQVDSTSGKVIFTQAYIRTGFGNPPDIRGTVLANPIVGNNLRELLDNIFSHWSSSDKHRHTGSGEVCHSSCHSNCHYNCHNDCHGSCHGWTIIRDNQ